MKEKDIFEINFNMTISHVKENRPVYTNGKLSIMDHSERLKITINLLKGELLLILLILILWVLSILNMIKKFIQIESLEQLQDLCGEKPMNIDKGAYNLIVI